LIRAGAAPDAFKFFTGNENRHEPLAVRDQGRGGVCDTDDAVNQLNAKIGDVSSAGTGNFKR
jgi:hypothetical protein